jgi:DNA-binding SARP family transcriptional activator/tetratricopeptide (TPR) repeat protein
MTVLRIQLLGGLKLTWGGSPLPAIPGSAARSLLAYLLTFRDRSHTRDLLSGTFWPDLPDATARRRLSQALWQIRRSLPDGQQMLFSEGDTIHVHDGVPLWIDVEEFGKHRLVCQEGGTQSLHLCQRCIDLYQGDFLAGYYDDWVIQERERLREEYLSTLEWLVAGYKGQGEYERGLVFARRLAIEDPWREEAHREIMRLCHLLDRGEEALQQFELCQQILAHEFSAEPSANTIALANEIRTSLGAASIPHLPVASSSFPLAVLERPDQIPLVARELERAELARHLESAMAGRGGMVLLAGEAGVGKSRLMQEVARDAAWRSLRVVWGHNYEMSSPPPYQPFLEILCDSDLAHLPEAWQRELGRLLPGLGVPPPDPEPDQAQGRLLEALTRALLSMGRSTPHLIVLEDLHWMDPASFEVLRVLLPRLPSSHVLVVGTFRPEDLVGQPSVHQSIRTLENTRIPQRMEIGPLTVSETEGLVQRLLELPQSAARFSQHLHTGTAGNPFFITETLRTLVDEGLLFRDRSGAWSTPWDSDGGDGIEMPIPDSVAQSIQQRLSRLPGEARSLLSVAAVIGRELDFDLWQQASDCEENATVDAVEELTRQGLLVAKEGDVSYRFVHDTIRQVVYEELSPLRRRWWHRRVAVALESLAPERVEDLAEHHRLGQNWSEATRYALQAGKRAQAVYANQQALDHYGRADAWLQDRVTWPAAQISRWRADLAERRGQVLSLVGKYEEAESAFDQARQMWESSDDPLGVARVLNRQSFLRFEQGDCTGASHFAEAALKVLDQEDSISLRATSLTYLGLCAWTQEKHDQALPPLQQALALFEEIGTDLHGLARCLNSLGLVYLGLHDLAQAQDCIAQSLVLRQKTGDRRGEAWCWVNQAGVALTGGDLTTARGTVGTAQMIFAEIEHPDGQATCSRVLKEIEEAESASDPTRRITVRLPSRSAPIGRPLKDGEFVTVSWTISAPEDGAIAKRTDRRQFRLLRLLREADEQGAAPTLDDLAAALDASQPTIKRDLAALRLSGHEVRTRGSR